MLGIESLTYDLLINLGLPFLAAVFFMEGALIGKMLPTDFLLPAAVVLYATQTQHYLLLLTITATSSTAGQYWLFRRFKGETLEDLYNSKLIKLSNENVDKLFKALERRGLKAVLFSNIIPGVRGLITVPAAIEGYEDHHFVTASATGTVIFQSILIGIGAGAVTLI